MCPKLVGSPIWGFFRQSLFIFVRPFGSPFGFLYSIHWLYIAFFFFVEGKDCWNSLVLHSPQPPTAPYFRFLKKWIWGLKIMNSLEQWVPFTVWEIYLLYFWILYYFISCVGSLLQRMGSVAASCRLSCWGRVGSLFSSQGWTHIPSMGRWTLNNWTTKEVSWIAVTFLWICYQIWLLICLLCNLKDCYQTHTCHWLSVILRCLQEAQSLTWQFLLSTVSFIWSLIQLA